ncbi:hypothetical protein Salat_2610700 [Sesamum alatum]|uniref:Arabidopsis retrotransposon Orf1 C-terminal domain-containing protein n=1 Tax=Sesamum alatum TaxID=300844 RepID=A0AAE1XPC8_9LAMI|nr:hypothetical protein Salat_2610700 [Sesamum alatum]
MDLDDRNRYEGLHSRTITNTRYIDNEVLDMLGISDDVEYLFAGLGWHYFMFTRWPTYPRLVREFLSSLRVEGILSGPHVDRGRITFRFRLIEGRMNLAQFNAIFGRRRTMQPVLNLPPLSTPVFAICIVFLHTPYSVGGIVRASYVVPSYLYYGPW